MNICFYLSSFTQGGIARSVSLVGNELAKKTDYNISALCHSNSGKEDIYHTDFEITYLYDRRIPVASAMLKDHYVKKVSAYLKKKAIDILIVCGELFAPAALLAGRKIPVLFWLHTSPFVDTDYRFQKTGRRLAFRFCSEIITITEKTKEIVSKKYRNKKITCIYNPADERLFTIKRKYDPDTMMIIAAGRLSYPKNYPSMIRIADGLRDELPQLRWHLYGEGADRPELEALIKENHLEDIFVLKGQCTELYERYNDYSAIVMTSRYEGFPMTLVEASACGLPMLSYDVLTGPSEIIDDGENGFLCPKDDEEEMKRKIICLFKDRALRLKMSENSRRTAQKLRIDRIADQWCKVIESNVTK